MCEPGYVSWSWPHGQMVRPSATAGRHTPLASGIRENVSIACSFSESQLNENIIQKSGIFATCISSSFEYAARQHVNKSCKSRGRRLAKTRGWRTAKGDFRGYNPHNNNTPPPKALLNVNTNKRGGSRLQVPCYTTGNTVCQAS